MDKNKLTFKQKLAALGLVAVFGFVIYFNAQQTGFLFTSREKSRIEKIVLENTEFLGVEKKEVFEHTFSYDFFNPPVKIDSPKIGDNFKLYQGARYKNNIGFLGYTEYKNGRLVLKDTSKIYSDMFMKLYEKFLEH